MNRSAIILLALAALPAGASAATQWLPSSPLAGQVRGTGTPAVAGNDDGRAVAAWATPAGVVTTLRTPGGPWYQPVRVPGSGRGATQVAVAMTTGGQAAVAWIEGGRVRVSLRPARRRFLPATALSLSGRIATTPVVALGGACSPLVAWSGEAVTGGASTIESACASPSGRFAATRPVSQPDEFAFTPAIAASPGGSVIAWRRDEGDQHRVRAAVRQRDGSFGIPADVSQASSSVYVDPSVAMAPSGGAIATWTLLRGADVVTQAASLPSGGVWTKPDDISRPGTQARGSQVATDGEGNAVATWVRSGVVQAATRVTGQPWGPPRDLSDGSVTAGTPRLSVSGGGAALVTWPATTGTSFVAQAALRAATADFGAPATISDPRIPAIAPEGVIGDNGVTPVVWQWSDPALDPSIAQAGVSSATGLAGSDQPGPAILVDLRARPATVSPGQRFRVTFGLSNPSRVRLAVTQSAGGREVGAIVLSGADGANAITFEGGLGGAALGRGRWRLTATPRGGTSRSLNLVVR